MTTNQQFNLDKQTMYKPPYFASNENQRTVTKFMNGQDVLTVASGGEQALFYKLAGCENVDTFDISPFARVIQDIKTTTVHYLTRDEYIKLINNIVLARNSTQLKQTLGDIYPMLPAMSRYIIEQNHPVLFFHCFGKPREYTQNYPSEDEYARLKTIAPREFPFIWSDIADISTKLTHQYDIINTSNIFDYMYSDKSSVAHTIYRLARALKPNGTILYLPQNACPIMDDIIATAPADVPPLQCNTVALGYCTIRNPRAILIQRTR